MAYKNLFNEGKLGKMKVKNRIIMPAMGAWLASADGEVTDHQIAYYEERARGGVGLIITEVTAVEYELGRVGVCHPRVDEAKFIPMLSRLADAVHKYDTKIFVQLNHAGRQTDTTLTGGRQPVAPSPIPCELSGITPRELTIEEIRELANQYVTCALICKSAGIDGVELHGAHGYLINEFLSPKTNIRDDEYGGDFKRRMRFVREIMEGIRYQCGHDYPVIIRLSIDEFADNGIDVAEGVKIAKKMQEFGVDAINASCGTYDSLYTVIEPITYAQGWRIYLSEAVKKEVAIPVIAVGVIREPDFAENVLRDRAADFVAIGRGLIADPEWCNKALNSRSSEIRKCISCLYCLDRVQTGRSIGCAINVKAGREIEFRDLKRDGDRRKTVVVGGGPAGLEAARILAMRSFDVVLFEKAGCLGGQLNYGSRPRGKNKLTWLIDYLSDQLKRMKVDLRLGTEADTEKISAEAPYAVFIATGACPIVPDIDGIEESHVLSVHEALLKSDSFEGQRIAVIGAGMTGCETAELIASSNANEVYLIEMLPDIASGANVVEKLDLMRRLNDVGVNILTDHKLLKIGNDAILINNVSENQKLEIKVDEIVISLGLKSDPAVYEALRASFDNVFLLGDAKSPRKIANAVRDGFEKAMLLV